MRLTHLGQAIFTLSFRPLERLELGHGEPHLELISVAPPCVGWSLWITLRPRRVVHGVICVGKSRYVEPTSPPPGPLIEKPLVVCP
jgi:hypothetical protein